MASSPSIFNRYSIVKKIPVFSKLNFIDLQRIARKSTIMHYHKGEMICQEDTPPDGFYCLVSGRIQGYTKDVAGSKHNVEFIRRGMHFGIVSLLTGENHSATFEAINDSIVLKIEKEDFEKILKSMPQLGIEFSHSLSKKIRRRSAEHKSTFANTIIAIYSPVKGTGSSTYAMNLALNLEQETSKKVILVNICSAREQGASRSSDVGEATPQWKQEAANLEDIMDEHEKVGQAIASGEIRIDLLNVKFDPQDSSLVNRISHFVTSLAHDYHYVIVDLPNDMDDVVLKTLTQSDIIQLITMDGQEDLQMARGVIYQLEEHLQEHFDLEKIQVIISGRQAACYLSYEEVNNEIDFDVYTKLPNIQRAELNVAVVSANISVITPEPDSEYARAIKRIARKISGVMVGLVLGGGAALGVAHVGVIRVLERENIPIDMVVGSSMGALLASMWVTGRNAAELELLAREFESKKDMMKLFDLVIPISGLVGGRMIKRWLKSKLGNKTFYSTDIPLKIVAYDLMKREEIVIHSGAIVEAVRRSIAIPGVIEPVLEDDKMIIDGGVLNPLPTNVPAQLGIEKIIAVNVLQSPEHVTRGYVMEQQKVRQESKIPFYRAPWHYLAFRWSRLWRRILTPNIPDIIVRSLQASEYVIAEQSAKNASVMIHPDLTGINWFELYKVDELIKRGEDAAEKALPAIKKLLQ